MSQISIEQLSGTDKTSILWTSESHPKVNDIEVGTRSMPLQGWFSTIRQRTVRIDYPENSRPTEQILGIKYEPFSMNGHWDDQFNAAGFCASAEAKMRKIVKEGIEVRMTFIQYVFTGIITSLSVRPRTEKIARYRFTFSPHTFSSIEDIAERPQNTTTKTSEENQEEPPSQEGNLRFTQQEQAFEQSQPSDSIPVIDEASNRSINLDSLPSETSERISSQVLSLNNEVDYLKSPFLTEKASNLASLSGLLESIVSKSDETLSSINERNGILLDILAEANDIRFFLESILLLPHDFLLLRQQFVLTSIMSGVIHSAQHMLVRVNRMSAPNIHIARPSDTVFSISNEFYGTSDYWRDILLANNLRTLELEIGQRIVLPDRSILGSAV